MSNTIFQTGAVHKALKAEDLNGMARRFKAAHKEPTVEASALLRWLQEQFPPNWTMGDHIYEKLIQAGLDKEI